MVSKVTLNDKAFKIGEFTYNSRKNFYHMKMVDNRFYELANRLESYYDIIDEYEDFKNSEEYSKNKREEYIKKIRRVLPLGTTTLFKMSVLTIMFIKSLQ